ncbi:MAG: 5'/3'-nucleotidase SurE [Desulfovibrio sp.]|nr:5'/3'-nucleotidase SurE [Desulfovibrio sp.]
MRILLTNDDGINAHGLRVLAQALQQKGHVVHSVAPMHQQSGVSQCLTIFEPLRIQEISDKDFRGTGVYGSPADCVKIALGALLSTPPDLIISGVNLGANVGSDLLYSGTVAAAIEGAQAGLPSIALSYNSHDVVDISREAAHMVALLEKIDLKSLPKGRVLNINYPSCPLEEIKGLRLCHQSLAAWENVYQQKVDPRGNSYFWLIGNLNNDEILPDSDRALLRNGYITVTPLVVDYTDRECLKALASTGLEAAL